MKRKDLEICKCVFETLFQKNPIHQSDLRSLTGLGPKSIKKWTDLITFIQSQPELKITKSGRYKMLELVKPPMDNRIYPETIEALKAMRDFFKLTPDEARKKIDELTK